MPLLGRKKGEVGNLMAIHTIISLEKAHNPKLRAGGGLGEKFWGKGKKGV